MNVEQEVAVHQLRSFKLPSILPTAFMVSASAWRAYWPFADPVSVCLCPCQVRACLRQKLLILGDIDIVHTVIPGLLTCVIVLCSQQFTDLASLSALAKYTTGGVYCYPGFNPARDAPKLQTEIKHNLTRQTGGFFSSQLLCDCGLMFILPICTHSLSHPLLTQPLLLTLLHYHMVHIIELS